MNKIILWVIAAIIVIGGGYWAYAAGLFGGAGASMGGSATSTAQMSSSGTIKDLLARGGTEECQVTEPSGGTSGTVFIGGGKVRGDFTTQSSSGAITSHMISDGSEVYVWSSAMAEGMKMSVAASATSSGMSSQQDIYNQNVNYDCSPWTADSAEFSLPQGVTFEDMSAMMQGSAGVSGSASACSACDQAPNAAAKAQCKAALHC